MAPNYTPAGLYTESAWSEWNMTTSNTTDATWITWTQTAASSTMIQSHAIWEMWTTTGTGSNSYNVPQMTEEERAEREERLRIERAQQVEAKERARALLVACLEERQKEELEQDGHFHVETRDGTRRYRLKPGAAPVRVHGEDGRRWSYCIHPEYGFPADDVVLAQKLLIETDEEAFLRIANASALSAV